MLKLSVVKKIISIANEMFETYISILGGTKKLLIFADGVVQKR